MDAEGSQIQGGLGSLLSLAQNSLASGDFDKITGAVPGVDRYLGVARDMGLLDTPITSMDGLKSALGMLGMSPDTIAQFVPAAVNALGQIGGPQVSALLASLTGA